MFRMFVSSCSECNPTALWTIPETKTFWRESKRWNTFKLGKIILIFKCDPFFHKLKRLNYLWTGVCACLCLSECAWERGTGQVWVCVQGVSLYSSLYILRYEQAIWKTYSFFRFMLRPCCCLLLAWCCCITIPGYGTTNDCFCNHVLSMNETDIKLEWF